MISRGGGGGGGCCSHEQEVMKIRDMNIFIFV